jgi:hypothetical protein
MENLFKQLMKEAVLEALNEFINGGVAVASESEDTQTSIGAEGKKETNKKEPESGKGGASAESSGGTPENGKTKPDVGVGGFSLR